MRFGSETARSSSRPPGSRLSKTRLTQQCLSLGIKPPVNAYGALLLAGSGFNIGALWFWRKKMSVIIRISAQLLAFLYGFQHF